MSNIDQRLREHFDALPPVAPPSALVERIGRAQRARVRRRRVGMIGAALALACVVAAPLLPHGHGTVEPALVQTRAPGADTLADVRALDRALQTAYERDASDDELAPLWAARARLLGSPARPAGI